MPRTVIIAACILFMLAPPVFSRPLVLGTSFTGTKLGAYLDYYVDQDGKSGISEIASPAFQDKFRPMPKEDYSFGYTKAAIWLRTVVVNTGARSHSWFLECEYPLLDSICFYSGPKDGVPAPTCTGDSTPFTTRPLPYRTFIFPVDSPPGESACYIRVASSGSLNISFTAWGRESLRENHERESIVIWIFYGIMISLFIYNLFIFLSVREMSHLYLSMFTITIALFSMCHNGLAFQYLWPAHPSWGNIAHPFFTASAAIFAILFTRDFLGTRTVSPWYDRLYQLFIGIEAALAAAVFFVRYSLATQFSTAMAALISIAVISNGTLLLFRGSRPARYYMTAWICFMIGVILIMLHSFGITHEGFLSNWGYQIGSSLVVILLSLGIADKINLMRAEKDQALDAIREGEEKYRALIETTGTGYVILDGQGRVIDANREYLRLTGHQSLDDIMQRSVTEWTSPADKEKNMRAVEMCMSNGYIRNLEIEYVHGNGEIMPVEINATVIEGKEGRRILSICRDFTYRRTVLNNLQASLREKEILLMEIHHRVKNNLQIISSLIDLQIGGMTDDGKAMLFEDLNNRIRAMSLIHERLYQSHDFARIDFAEYIRLITHDLQSTYRNSCGACSLEFDMEPIELDIVKAMPCGLMINEIVSNTFKYAFPPAYQGRGRIRISFRELEDGVIELNISDNGIGLPETIDPVKAETLGLSLVFLLAEQIDGRIHIDRHGGTTYTVLFNRT